jgi:ankyrin repeat protein
MLDSFDLINRGKFYDLKRAIFYKKVNFSAKNSYGDTILHIFLREGLHQANPDIMDSILKAIYSISFQNNVGDTPLHLAASAGDLDMVERLLKKGANPLLKNRRDKLPIDDVAICDDKEQLTNLLSAAAKLLNGDYLDDDVDITNLLNVKDEKRRSPLHIAVEKGNKDLVKRLIAKKANVSSRDSKKRSPLHIAVEKGNKDLVKLLLDAGADVNALDFNYISPLHIAVEKGNKDLVKLLLDAGADVNALDFKYISPLHIALKSKNQEIETILLNAPGIDCNIRDVYGCSPLFFAIKIMKDVELVKLLLQKGADVNAELVTGGFERPIHSALKHGSEECINFLLAQDGIDFNVQDENKDTPLHIAIMNMNSDIANKLIEYGANPFLANDHKYRSVDLIKRFMDKDADELYYKANKYALLEHIKYGVIPFVCVSLMSLYGYHKYHVNAIPVLYVSSFALSDIEWTQVQVSALYCYASSLIVRSFMDSCEHPIVLKAAGIGIIASGAMYSAYQDQPQSVPSI